MAKIYFKNYKKLIDNGTLTFEEALADVEAKVPERWKADVIAMLEEEYEVIPE